MSRQIRLILASTSAYRRQLLERLRIPFECERPETDESPLSGETFVQTALRLSAAKARAVSGRCPGTLIIGSDQVASCEGRRLDKPGNHATAVEQLRHVSGRTAVFDTAVSVLDTASGQLESRLIPCRVVFRTLSEERIERYLRLEQPYDCAGSAKSEGLGVVLMERIECEDPTALIGLPLIAVSELLTKFGLDPLRPPPSDQRNPAGE